MLISKTQYSWVITLIFGGVFAGNLLHLPFVAAVRNESSVVNDDNPAVCAFIGGIISTDEDETVKDVKVSLSGSFILQNTTGSNGAFGFSCMPYGQGYEYVVTPQLNMNPTNGVSNFDAVLITKHILSIQPIIGPYKRIAADVNNSHSISTADIIALRRLILHVDDTLTNNPSWRFIPESYVFPDPNNPWVEVFPETALLSNIGAGYTQVNFIGIKIGDVNGSAAAN